jgi:hypothetical protein
MQQRKVADGVMAEGEQMNKKEALEMLDKAPCGDKPSKLNPILSQKDAVETIMSGVMSLRDDTTLSSMYEKRVWQVFKNQKRPKYTSL